MLIFHFNLIFINMIKIIPDNTPGAIGSHRRLLREARCNRSRPGILPTLARTGTQPFKLRVDTLLRFLIAGKPTWHVLIARLSTHQDGLGYLVFLDYEWNLIM